MAGRYFISTTIPYVNGSPHIGHAEEFVQTDVFGRYHRLAGIDTYVLTGTDENSLKNVQAAEKEGISVEQLVERNSQRFKDLAEALDFRYDQLIRTSVDPRHKAAAEKIWRAVDARGDIYRKYYSGLYCVGCELYYNESELDENGRCPEGHDPPELIEEENYFFRLSRYQDQLLELISTDRLLVIPQTRKNEVLSFVSRGLQDFSISRSRERAKGWGIPVPDDPSQVIYVWFDALINYISALDYGTGGELYDHYWADNPDRVHALGKGVIRFHAVYWPAMLLSAGIPLPTTEFVHGYILLGGARVSKSQGNVIDPAELVERYGTEAVRYYLLRAVPPTGDHSFTFENFEARYNADLANDLGNLLNRTVSMIGRYRGGTIPEAGEQTGIEEAVRAVAARSVDGLCEALDRYDPQRALDGVWELVTRTNRYVEETAPWTLSKAARAGDEVADRRLDTALATLAESVRVIGASLEPILPETARNIAEQLGVAGLEGTWQQRLSWGASLAGLQVTEPRPLFPRLEMSLSGS